jgi:hypothetical protein
MTTSHSQPRPSAHRQQPRDQVLRQAGRKDRQDGLQLHRWTPGCEFGPSQTSGRRLVSARRELPRQHQGSELARQRSAVRSANTYYDPAANFAPGVNPKQSFIGYMFYNRLWWGKDHDGLTIGGGPDQQSGTLPGAGPGDQWRDGDTSAALGAPYFTGIRAIPFSCVGQLDHLRLHAQAVVTWRFEYDYRHASVPYWSGDSAQGRAVLSTSISSSSSNGRGHSGSEKRRIREGATRAAL